MEESFQETPHADYVLFVSKEANFNGLHAQAICDRFFQVREARNHFLVDLSGCTAVDASSLYVLAKALKSEAQAAINVGVIGPASLKSKLDKQGLGDRVKYYLSLDQVISDSASPEFKNFKKALARKETREFVGTTVRATKEVFGGIAHIKVLLHRASLSLEYAEPMKKCPAAAGIPMNCPQFHGKMFLFLSKESYLEIMSRFLRADGPHFETLEEIPKDGISELLNILSATLRAKFDEEGLDAGVVLPQVLDWNRLQEVASESVALTLAIQADIGDIFLKYVPAGRG